MSETMTKSKLNEKAENVNILKEECALMVKKINTAGGGGAYPSSRQQDIGKGNN